MANLLQILYIHQCLKSQFRAAFPCPLFLSLRITKWWVGTIWKINGEPSSHSSEEVPIQGCLALSTLFVFRNSKMVSSIWKINGEPSVNSLVIHLCLKSLTSHKFRVASPCPLFSAIRLTQWWVVHLYNLNNQWRTFNEFSSRSSVSEVPSIPWIQGCLALSALFVFTNIPPFENRYVGPPKSMANLSPFD